MSQELAYLHANEVSGSLRAAERIVPAILQATGHPKSILDVGGGTGAWLQAFEKCGVQEVCLVDTGAVEPALLIDRSKFRQADLNAEFPEVGRFELAVCVECAEHLQPDRSRPLVEYLTLSADVVVFSAAPPGQAGKGHINLRPPEFWSDLFNERGFFRHDVLRSSILWDQEIPWWYRQNLYVFAKPEMEMFKSAQNFLPDDFHLCHRYVIEGLLKPNVRTVLAQLFMSLGRAFKYRMGFSKPSAQ